MKERWQNLPWYSKVLFAVLVAVLIVYLATNLFSRKDDITNITTTPDETPDDTDTQISVSSKELNEENFTGSIPVINGKGEFVDRARAYVDSTLSDFRISANEDVPAMREQFGADSPTANYTLDIKARHVQNSETQSIVLSSYVYTGGANGNNFYKVFTASVPDGKILTLSSLIREERKADFTRLVKDSLLKWRPGGADSMTVFEDAVADLTFQSFDDWSLDDKNLILYFDKYEIGPGALGAVEFPLPVSVIKAFLK